MRFKHFLFHRLKHAKGLWFHIAGIIALFWFLIRVIPKPTRSQYPCQQIAIPIALGYIAFWSVLFTTVIHFLRRAQRKTTALFPAAISLFILLSSITGFGFASIITSGPTYEAWTPIPNEPIGVPQGVSPGRVVWMWNPDATEKDLDGYWWEPQNNNQAVIDEMMAQGIKELANVESIPKAWNKLFTYINIKNERGENGYQSGEKIAIKVNLNNCWNPLGWNPWNPRKLINEYEKEDNERDAHPLLINALLDQLVKEMGISEEDIIIYDASRPMPNWFYDPIYNEFPNVHFLDNSGGEKGRDKVIPSDNKIYFTDGTIKSLPICVTQSSYIINVPLLKHHPINQGVTLSGKNLFGSFTESVMDIHPYHESGQFMDNAAPQTDLLGHRDLGQKTVLYLGDALFATKYDHRTISRFDMYPFNDDWTNSLFFSQDPVAIDSVMYDFLHTEGPIPLEGSQNYLHQAADPPLNVYDPEKDNEFISESLGVHEHWTQDYDIFSSDRYHSIDYIPIGRDFASPSIVIEKPNPGIFYVFDNITFLPGYFKDYCSFPVPYSIIIGSLTIETRVTGKYVDMVDKVSFFVDDQKRFVDNTIPFSWELNQIPAGFHTIKVIAYEDDNPLCSATQEILKIK